MISTICLMCGTTFSRFPAFHRHAEKRGTTIKFCSRACTDAARSAGTIGRKKRRGKTLTCEVCNTEFYVKSSQVKRKNRRFCSQACRIEAFKRKLIDRTGPRPNRRLGEMIQCQFCSTVVYRKRSMVARDINKTCGEPACVSAYGRQLWGLAPRETARIRQPKHLRKYRKDNFNSSQRKKWIDTKCAYCGTTKNLTLDHIIPVCAGGKATRKNAQTLCGPCNNWKAEYVDRPLARKQASKGGSVS